MQIQMGICTHKYHKIIIQKKYCKSNGNWGKIKSLKTFLIYCKTKRDDEFRTFSFGAVNRNVYKKSGSKIKQAMIQ